MTSPALKPAVKADQFIASIISGYWLSRAIAAANRLNIPDYVANEPTSVQEIANRAGADPGALYRLMRALATAGIFQEHEDRRFSHTELSELFRSDITGTLKHTAISELDTDHYAAWENLLYSLRTGGIAFDQRFGMPIWQYYAENPDLGQTFERSMTAITERVNDDIMRSYSFSGFKKVVDVGGGEGFLLKRVLQESPSAQGIIFDRPEVTAMASRSLQGDPLAERVTTFAGDFFQALPAADLYLLKWIIHDWAEAEARTILTNCRASLLPNGKVLLFEMVLPPANEGMFPKLMDLNMLVMTGGRERDESEYRALLKSAGLRLTQVIPTGGLVSIVEAVAA